jgi:hypothetical protein
LGNYLGNAAEKNKERKQEKDKKIQKIVDQIQKSDEGKSQKGNSESRWWVSKEKRTVADVLVWLDRNSNVEG